MPLPFTMQGIGPVSRAQYLQMIGRAGRAGHATVGEAYIIGQGNPDASFGEWKAICELLVAPVPSLHSQLLAEDAFTDLPSSSNQTASAPQPQVSSATQAAQESSLGLSLQHSSSQQSSLSQSRVGQPAAVATHSSEPMSHLSIQSQQVGTARHNGRHLQLAELLPGLSQQGVVSGLHMLQAATQKSTSASHRGGEAQLTGLQAQPNQQSVPTMQTLGPSQPARLQMGCSQQSAAHGPHGLPDQAAATLPLQRMLLEAVANKSIQSLQDILTLASSTLLSHQAHSGRVKRAIKSALQTLEYVSSSTSLFTACTSFYLQHMWSIRTA